MNTYIKMQIDNAIVFSQMFIKSWELAVLKDDGTVSKEEEIGTKKKDVSIVENSTFRYILFFKVIQSNPRNI